MCNREQQRTTVQNTICGPTCGPSKQHADFENARNAEKVTR